MKEVINRIRFFREKSTFSGSELSGRIGKHDKYIAALESKGFNLPVPVLMDILEVLNVSEVQFFADNYKTYKEDNHLLDLISKLPKEKKELIIKLIEN